MNATYLQAYGIVKRETTRFLSMPYQTIFSPAMTIFLYLLIFGISLNQYVTTSKGDLYLHFLIPGLIAMSALRNALENSSSSLISAKYTNELQDLKTTPMGTHTLILGLTFASVLRGMLVSVVCYVISMGFLFLGGFPLLKLHSFATLFLFLFFGSASFALLGISIGIHSREFEHLGMISSFIITPLIYLGGVFFSLERMHPLWKTISSYNPFLYIIEGVRCGFLGSCEVSLVYAWVVIGLFLSICYSIAYIGFANGKNYFR